MGKFAIPCGLALACLLAAQSAMGQKPAPAETAAALAAIREYALNYTERLPNFTCTLVVRHTLTPARRGIVALTTLKAENDVIEELLSFVNHREIHQVVRFNGRPPVTGQDQTMSSTGEFGNLLNSVMDPKTGAEYKFDHIETLNGKKVHVFAYFIDQKKGYGIISGEEAMLAPYHGLIYADVDTHAVLRIRADIGPIADYREMDLTLDYKPIKVAGQEFLLPSHYKLHVLRPEFEVSNDSNYTNYKRFETESTLTFDTEPEEAGPQR